MRSTTMSAVAALSLALLAATGDKLPISGSWNAEPSPGIVGPAGLTISDRSIAFGPNSEKMTRWSMQENIVTIYTAAGHNYSFRVDSTSRICLVSSVRPRSVYGTSDAIQVRCYVKPANKQGA